MLLRSPTIKIVLPCLLVALLGGLSCTEAPPPAFDDDAPRLILFIVVDQARGDYLERFRPLFDGGLGQLLDESVVFTDVHHDHAATLTAPGHATLATGCFPSRHGIVANGWYDRRAGEEVAAVEDEDYDPERSPRRLLAPTFSDWLKAVSPQSKVFAASGKDRAAILTAGKAADGAYWYDHNDGHFVTSTYYRREEPEWLNEFHRDLHPNRYFGRAWEPLPAVVAEGPAFDVEPVDGGLIGTQLPRPFGPAAIVPSDDFYEALYDSPVVDQYLGELAKALIDGEQLGQDDHPDFLGLSFSAVDSVGHDYGPHSPELLDTLLKLDRTLADLLAFVDQRIGLQHVLISLAGDHGVALIPELLQARGVPARRFGVEEITCVQRVRGQLRERFGAEEWVLGGLYLDRDLAAERGVALSDLENEIRRRLEACPGVARVRTRAELLSPAAGDPMGRLFAHSFHPERSPDLMVQLDENALPVTRSATTHGSPYPYDTLVPWLLRLPGGGPGVVAQRVHTVDVAPTIARLIGLEPSAEIDGIDRRSLLPGSKTSG